jgi:hypothetical protein
MESLEISQPTRVSSESRNVACMFADVESYGSRPTHRTGTNDDAATIEWLRSLLLVDGASVTVDPWRFPQWIAEWSAQLDGVPIESLPLFYETSGSFERDAIDIVATKHPGGLLTVRNQRALHEVSELPRATLQVAGQFAGREADVRAHIDNARIVEGRSANVLASFGCDFGDGDVFGEMDVLIATPISGWFSCASERGTGIAIGRWLLRTLAQAGLRVGFLATSGHELFNLGLEHHLQRHLQQSTFREGAQGCPNAKMIVHVGASVAARMPGEPLALSDQLYTTSNTAGVGSALEAIGFHNRLAGPDPKQWIGEGTRWCSVGRPLLSIAGMSHWFHTPEDTPERSTSPELLDQVATALYGEVLTLLAAVS